MQNEHQPNNQYSMATPSGIVNSVAVYQRRRMYAQFLKETCVASEDTILDIGVTSDRRYEASNYVEEWYPHKDKITAVGIDDASFLEDLYPGLRFVHANGLDLPFANSSFDIVHSSAVLEHVGSFEQQLKLVSECVRVARKAIFLTTPNRWFPIEFHTLLPLVHWLPKPLFRTFLRQVRLDFFAEESNLNLMSRNDLIRVATFIKDFHSTRKDFRFEVSSVSLLGWPSNLLLTGQRLIEDVKSQPNGAAASGLARVAMALFWILFKFNLRNTPFGWQIVAIARKTKP